MTPASPTSSGGKNGEATECNGRAGDERPRDGIQRNSWRGWPVPSASKTANARDAVRLTSDMDMIWRHIIIGGLALIASTLTIVAEPHPIVEVDTGYFFGATSAGKWIKAEKAAKVVGAETTYRVYGLMESLGETKGGKPAPLEDVCMETMNVSLSPKPEAGVIALAAPWDALPRKARVAAGTQQVYIDVVRDFLKRRGIKDPKVKIKRVLRVDLDGDGEDEELVSATNYLSAEDEEVPASSPEGSYSIVLLRQMVGGKLKTRVVAGEVHADAKHSDAPNWYDVSAVLDLDGDGKLEVVVHSHYYEGGSTTIYRCTPSKITPLLEVACGV
jgi:hypothetical protein